MAYWLLKTEPETYSIEDLRREGRAIWDGVRNYQARNYLLRMGEGDLCFIYHSSTNPPGIAGLARVVRTRIPEPPPSLTREAPTLTPGPPRNGPAGTRWRWPSSRPGPSSP
jgi:predicted RNA-binding protein with PUA-like domain